MQVDVCLSMSIQLWLLAWASLRWAKDRHFWSLVPLKQTLGSIPMPCTTLLPPRWAGRHPNKYFLKKTTFSAATGATVGSVGFPSLQLVQCLEAIEIYMQKMKSRKSYSKYRQNTHQNDVEEISNFSNISKYVSYPPSMRFLSHKLLGLVKGFCL